MGIQASCDRGSFLRGWPAGNDSDYKQDGVKEVKVNDDQKVLVVKSQGSYYGIGSQCPHYGANLAQGTFTDGKITCPWHGACFDVASGDIEDFPGLDALPTYKVSKKSNGDLTVFCPRQLKFSQLRPMECWRSAKITIVIIGAGPAGLMAAQTLRQNSFDGRIRILTKDSELPYDKTRLSKELNLSIFQLQLRDSKFFNKYGIDVVLKSEVKSVNFMLQQVYLTSGDGGISYDKLLIATGSRTPSLAGQIPGGDLKNIITLNSFQEAQVLYASIESGDKIFVVIGGTFLGLEVASVISSKCAKVYVIGSRNQPLEYLIGPTASSAILGAMSLVENVLYLAPDEIRYFLGDELGKVTNVMTQNNGSIPCHGVILAMNPKPNTSFLDSRDLMMNMQTGGVVVDSNMQTSAANVYAAGDIAEYTFDNCSDPSGRASTLTWNTASYHGKVVAQKMLELPGTVVNCVPFFWSSMFGLNLSIVGHIKGADDITVYSKINNPDTTGISTMSFCSLFRQKAKIIGAVTTGDCDPLASRIASDLRSGGARLSNEYITFYINAVFPDDPFREEPAIFK